MARLGRGGGMKLAAVLGLTGVILAWSGFHVYKLVLESLQPCEMTYMYPSYTVVNIATTTRSSPVRSKELSSVTIHRITTAVKELGGTNYRLWRYTGDDPGRRRGSGLVLPVLFIPGNNGSHEMARSLASETSRRFSRLGVQILEPVELVWYMLDLEGELSAFDGRILEAQVKFALAAMKHLAAVHNITVMDPANSKNRVSGQVRDDGIGEGRRWMQQHPGLVLVGHSMGGVVAADALARAAEDPELGPSIAALLVTFGAPHARPPAPGDPSLQSFYAGAARRPRPVVPLLSIAGGVADYQVAAELTNPEGLTPQGMWRWLALPNLPGGWCPSDHNSLVWCNQLMVRLGQAMVDLAQDALPGLEAARKEAAARAGRRTTARAARGHGGTAADSSPAGLDGAVETDPSAAPGGQRGSAAARASSSSSSSPPPGGHINGQSAAQPIAVENSGVWKWDWAIRRLDQHLSHPAHQYLEEALAA
ncbi:hypothetical protein Vafri_16685, partial [Volvox africanus]